jgi:hypothetical protein
MPSLYIILEKKIPSTDTYANGSFLSKNSDELDQMAARLGVEPLMAFFSISNEELSALMEEHDANFNKPKAGHQEKWFTPDEGLRTVNALLQELASSKLDRLDRIETELREFEKVLEVAKANGVRWHLGVDY